MAALVINAIGRRKSAIARAYMSVGSGKIIINNRELTDYFPSGILQYVVTQPLTITGNEGKYDIKANLDGGGVTGQAGALSLAIARALCEVDKEAFRPALKAKGLLTRDSREVERKKPGQPGARKRFQFSKR
jgi:small subunit ribosomal protein S9